MLTRIITILLLTIFAASEPAQATNSNLLTSLRETTVEPSAPIRDVHVKTYFPLHRTHSTEGAKHGRFLDSKSPRLSALHSDQYGHAYRTPVKIGHKTFNLMLDTASSDTWVAYPSVECRTKYPGTGPLPQSACGFQDFYEPGPEFKQAPNQNFDISYGDLRFARGVLGKTDVEVAGINVNTQIAVAKQASWNGNGFSSGMLGLAYPDITFAFQGTNYSDNNLSVNQVPYDPVFTTMWKSGKVAPTFSVAFSRPAPQASSKEQNKPDGYLALGGLPPVDTIGPWARSEIQIPPKDSRNYYLNTTRPWPQYQWYTITPDTFLLCNSSRSNPEKPKAPSESTYKPCKYEVLPNPEKSQIMLDGGATQAYLPTHMSDAIAAAFDPPAIYNKTLGFYHVPCNAKAPAFAVEIGGVAFPVDKKDMVIDDETGRGTCMSGVNNGNMYAPYVFGGTFMKNVLTVFDVGRGELRFRARKPY